MSLQKLRHSPGGWTNPFEKYAGEIEWHFPRNRGEKPQRIWMKPPLFVTKNRDALIFRLF